MAKPTTGEQSEFVQIAVQQLVGVIDGHVANNPAMAHAEKMHALVERSGAFAGIASQIQVGDSQQLAARPVGEKQQTQVGIV